MNQKQAIDQKLIWDHFQTQGIEAFDGSIPRLSFLVNQALKIFKKNNISEPTVLNIGVGNGWLETQCIKKEWNTYSLDPSEVAIERIAENGGSGKVGIIEDIPYDNDTFDVVFCSEVLEHLSEQQLDLGLKEIKRVLVNGGHLIGTVPFQENLISNQTICPCCNENFHRWGHQQSFDIAKLKVILESANFKIESLKTCAFADFSRKGFKNQIKSFTRYLLGELGAGIAQPNLFFITKNLKNNVCEKQT